MVPNDPKYVETLGSPIISFYELLMINKHYGCDSKNTCGVDNLTQAKRLFNTIQRSAFRLNLRNVRMVVSPILENAVRAFVLAGMEAHYATKRIGDCNYIISVSGGNVSTPKPQPQQKCVDNPKCALLTKTRKFCSSVVFTESIKRALCPKTCGYCR
ncbi:shTK domain protein [Ancylostoma caninum]|uniref:ShTK domain protein n=1 Tax=Ancylostoma caninum TaxID=29170 RepID=A0A368FFY6_ANCCA|nr:shTK domain protein [Ancylostoma caninum]